MLFLPRIFRFVPPVAMSSVTVLSKIETASKTSSADLDSALSDFITDLGTSEIRWSLHDLDHVITVTLDSEYFDANCFITLAGLCSFDDVRYLLMRELLKKLQNAEGSLAISFSDVLKFLDQLDIDMAATSKHDEEEDDGGHTNFLSDFPESQHHPAKNLKYHASLFEKIVLWLSENAIEQNHRQKFLTYSASFQDNMLKPFLLGDFYTKCIKARGLSAVLALQGVIKLMQLHNFEYPDFYTDLYGLICPENFVLKKARDVFVAAIDVALRSTHVSQCAVASFLKRLSRIALFATPDVVLVILSIVYNALVRHEACRVLIDKRSQIAFTDKCNSDPFDADAADPLLTNAINSSLWELLALQRHWHPHVAKSAARFGSQLVKIEEEVAQISDESSIFALRHACRSVKDSSRIFNKSGKQTRLNLEAPSAEKNFFLLPFCRA